MIPSPTQYDTLVKMVDLYLKNGGMTYRELSEATGKPAPTVASHFSALQAGGYASRTFRNRSIKPTRKGEVFVALMQKFFEIEKQMEMEEI